MGKQRMPRSHHITPEGFQRLSDELRQLWKVERPRITQSVAEAAAQGDRSENAEYIYGKKRLREIDSRVRFLRKRLAELKVVNELPADTNRVFFGAWVTLETEEGDLKRYRIVGSDEFDPAKGYISMDSPMGRALIGRQLDDEVSVARPMGRATFIIMEISYTPPTDELSAES